MFFIDPLLRLRMRVPVMLGDDPENERNQDKSDDLLFFAGEYEALLKRN